MSTTRSSSKRSPAKGSSAGENPNKGRQVSESPVKGSPATRGCPIKTGLAAESPAKGSQAQISPITESPHNYIEGSATKESLKTDSLANMGSTEGSRLKKARSATKTDQTNNIPAKRLKFEPPSDSSTATDKFVSDCLTQTDQSGCSDLTAVEDKFHPDGSKVFNDPVHGHMEFHPLCVSIIDTPQFQRLRHLKQLGATYQVYPGAAHNRFEHSLGVGHLAGMLMFDLMTRQPELKITWKDIVCVQIAGLCHDLGHGPFSHLFEHRFVPATRPTHKQKKWTHEVASVNMFNYMVNQEANRLKQKFDYWNFTDEDIGFIKELILGKHPKDDKDCRYGKEKAFLYEIVANKRNGVDVDKWDYFKRDCLQLGIFSSFDHTRFIKFARVIDVDGEQQICVREKEALDVYQMFHTRHSLHLKAYQHKSAYVIGVMLTDAMISADEHILIPGDNGKWCKMSECVDPENIDAYMNLTDNVISHILMTRHDGLVSAQKLVRDVERRKLYKCVGESMPSKDSDAFDEKDVENGINQEIQKMCGKSLSELSRFVVQVVKLDFGKGDQNPVDHLRFFSKHDKTKAVRVRPAEVSSFLPQVVFKEQLVRVFFRLTDNPQQDLESLKMLKEAFQSWCRNKIGEKGFKFFTFPKSALAAANQATEPKTSQDEV